MKARKTIMLIGAVILGWIAAIFGTIGFVRLSSVLRFASSADNNAGTSSVSAVVCFLVIAGIALIGAIVLGVLYAKIKTK